VERAVDDEVAELEPDDPVVAGERLVDERSHTPVASHSSRRRRSVDSEVSVIRPATSQLQPVTRRTRIPKKHFRSLVRGRWQPTTLGASASMMGTSTGLSLVGCTRDPSRATTTTGGCLCQSPIGARS
jgi:hypothetical protein